MPKNDFSDTDTDAENFERLWVNGRLFQKNTKQGDGVSDISRDEKKKKYMEFVLVLGFRPWNFQGA